MQRTLPIGLIVNEVVNGCDEGADFRNYTYAKYGREILVSRRIAFQIYDQQTIPLCARSTGSPVKGRANT